MIRSIWALIFLCVAETPVSGEEQDRKEWTFLVFLNADNDLDRAGFKDIIEMEKVGSSNWMNIVVQFDTLSPKGAPDEGTRRYYVEKNSSSSISLRKIGSKLLETLPEQDMGSTETLVEFVRWATSAYPADHYYLVLWNHGSGWVKSRLHEPMRAISYDETEGTSLSMIDLRVALEEITKEIGSIDILGFDACEMAMAEVMAEVAPFAEIMVGSEEAEPFDGWPYNDFLRSWTEQRKGRTLSHEEIVRLQVKTYLRSYDNGSQGTSEATHSAVRLREFDTFVSALNDFASKVIADRILPKENLKSIARATQAYFNQNFKDLGHFIEGIHAEASQRNNLSIIDETFDVGEAMKSLIIAEGWVGEEVKNSRGIAIHLPGSKWGTWVDWSQEGLTRSYYQELRFAEETQWDELLDYLYLTPQTPLINFPQLGLPTRWAP